MKISSFGFLKSNKYPNTHNFFQEKIIYSCCVSKTADSQETHAF